MQSHEARLESDCTVTFGPGETSKVITINAISDNLAETDEGFVVVLSRASAESQILIPSASGTIREGCLTVGNLVAGDNVLTYTCGVPGTIVAFAMGSGLGSTAYSQFGVTLGLAAPTIIGIGVTDANGVARIIVRLTAAQLLSPLYFQAFEASPVGTVSNIVIR